MVGLLSVWHWVAASTKHLARGAASTKSLELEGSSLSVWHWDAASTKRLAPGMFVY